MNIERLIINTVAFLSGCVPVALIEFVCVFFFGNEATTTCVRVFSIMFCLVTIISTFIFIKYVKKNFLQANTYGKISNLRRRDIFSSGAISYYVLPFISFVGNDSKSMVILIILVVLLTVIFNNNMMFMYTPILDLFQYKVLEGDLLYNDYKCSKVILLVKNDKNLFFTGTNDGVFKKVQDGLYFFISFP